ncbi:MAG: DUF3006 domain-containing protein [Gemmatimonadota bacterium]|nr:DUF3006 domain-containing protein [Gemmatimonadota bacterium]
MTSETADEERWLAVDRIEGARAVLQDDSGTSYERAVSSLPVSARREGAVLRVIFRGATPRWDTARADAAEETRRLADARARLDRLKKSDRGGDVSL